jgi:hypothetical protein
MTSCTPKTNRTKYRVIVSSVSSSPRAYSRGLIRFVAWGEKMIPARREITRMNVRMHCERELEVLTSFRKVVFFLQ